MCVIYNILRHFEYIYQKGGIKRDSYTIDEYPAELRKKVFLMKHFRDHLSERMFKPSWVQSTDPPKTENMDFVTKYLKTKHAVLFRLSHRIVQVSVIHS